MQILFETALFCLAIVAPALIASSFKSDPANRFSSRPATAGDSANEGYAFSVKRATRWFGKRKSEAVV